MISLWKILWSFLPLILCCFPLGVGINGEILIIHNISRYCDGIYECVAFNDVPPAVNRVISVMVECEYHSLVHSVISFQFYSHIFSRLIVKALLRVKKTLLVEALDGYVDFQILDCRIRPMVPLWSFLACFIFLHFINTSCCLIVMKVNHSRLGANYILPFFSSAGSLAWQQENGTVSWKRDDFGVQGNRFPTGCDCMEIPGSGSHQFRQIPRGGVPRPRSHGHTKCSNRQSDTGRFRAVFLLRQ